MLPFLSLGSVVAARRDCFSDAIEGILVSRMKLAVASALGYSSDPFVGAVTHGCDDKIRISFKMLPLSAVLVRLQVDALEFAVVILFYF